MRSQDKINQISTAFENFIMRLNPSIEDSREIAVKIGNILDNHVAWKKTLEKSKEDLYGPKIRGVLADLEELKKIKIATLKAAVKDQAAYGSWTSFLGWAASEPKKVDGE